MRVLTDRALQNKLGPTSIQMPLNAIAEVIAGHRHAAGLSSSVDPRVVATCIVAMRWGLNVLETRWLEALDLDEIPNNQVVTSHSSDARRRRVGISANPDHQSARMPSP